MALRASPFDVLSRISTAAEASIRLRCSSLAGLASLCQQLCRADGKLDGLVEVDEGEPLLERHGGLGIIDEDDNWVNLEAAG